MVRGRPVSLFGGGSLPERDSLGLTDELIASVHGATGELLQMGLLPDLVFLDDWLLRTRPDKKGQAEQEERLAGFDNPELSESTFLILRSSPRIESLDKSRIPFAKTIHHIGLSELRRKCWLVLRDHRVGSFPNFRLSSGMSAAILLLSAGATSVRMFGFDSTEKPSTRAEHSHVMADTYAVILEARLGPKLKLEQGRLSAVQSNWGHTSPTWAKRTLGNSLLFSGVFWW